MEGQLEDNGAGRQHLPDGKGLLAAPVVGSCRWVASPHRLAAPPWIFLLDFPPCVRKLQLRKSQFFLNQNLRSFQPGGAMKLFPLLFALQRHAIHLQVHVQVHHRGGMHSSLPVGVLCSALNAPWSTLARRDFWPCSISGTIG